MADLKAELSKALALGLACLSATGAIARTPGAPQPPPDWSSPFDVRLPDPARQIRLQPGTDAARWAGDQGLAQFRTLYQSPRGAILETSMNEADWQTFASTVCRGGDVAACETATCQTIQFDGAVTPGEGADAQAVKARLVRRAPERAPVADDPDGEAVSCRNPAAVPPLDDTAAGLNQNITLDIRRSERPGGREASSSAEAGAADGGAAADRDVPANAAEQAAGTDRMLAVARQPAPAADGSATASRRSFDFDVSRGFDALGGASLSAEEMPADTSDWSLVVSAGCSAVEVPLDALEPAQVPGQIVALVAAGTSAAVAAAFNLVVIRDIDLDSTDESLTVFAGADNVPAVAAAMLLDVRVSAAQPEFVYRTSAELGGSGAVSYTDPFASLSYGPQLTGVLGLHPAALGGGQLVAVIDTGVDDQHPELDQRLQETVDVTDRGWSADLHGTAVAGIIAANANNAQGSFGVAPNAGILAIKACQPVEEGALRAKCWTSTLVKSLDLALSRNAAVINMSLAGPPDDLLARYVNLAVAQDRLVIAASGNNGPHGRPGYPAALPDVLAVTAVDAAERRYDAANVGRYIDVAAPGVDIISPAPDGHYPPLSGTSMAAAHVAGAAALLKELAPLMGGRELAAVLRGQARDLGDPGDDELFGAGLVDACRAADQATAQAVSCTTPGGNHGPL